MEVQHFETVSGIPFFDRYRNLLSEGLFASLRTERKGLQTEQTRTVPRFWIFEINVSPEWIRASFYICHLLIEIVDKIIRKIYKPPYPPSRKNSIHTSHAKRAKHFHRPADTKKTTLPPASRRSSRHTVFFGDQSLRDSKIAGEKRKFLSYDEDESEDCGKVAMRLQHTGWCGQPWGNSSKP